MPTVTTTQTQEVQLRPEVRRKLLVKLKTYESLAVQVEAGKRAMQKIKDDIERAAIDGKYFDELSTGIKMEGFSVKHVSGTSSRLDKKKLTEAGVSTAQILAATVTTPSKPYVKITTPGEVATRKLLEDVDITSNE